MKLTLNEILYYYDEPQIFSSIDEYGVSFLSLLVEDSTYLTVKPTFSIYQQFLGHRIDLLSLIKSAETVGTVKTDFSVDEFVFEELTSEIPIEWLPDSGFILAPTSQEDLAVEARRSKTCLAAVGIQASESERSLEIYSDKLSDFVGGFEKLFENVYGAFYRNLSRVQKKNWPSESPKLMVAGIAPGSFKIQLKSDEGLDLLGDSRSAMVFEELENILRLIASKNKENVKAALKSQFGGKATASLLKLADIIIKRNTPFYLEWATPRSYSDRVVYSSEIAKFMYSNFAEGEELEVEDVVHVGSFVKVDVIGKKWTLQIKNEDGKYKNISGKVLDPAISLDGVVVKSTQYQLNCKLVTKFDFSKGKEVEELVLASDPEKI